MNFEFFELGLQTNYADLLRYCMQPVSHGHGISFSKKRIKNKDYWYLTAKIGYTKAIYIESFKRHAKPLRFMDFLFDDIEPAIIPYQHGILVNIPNPARFA